MDDGGEELRNRTKREVKLYVMGVKLKKMNKREKMKKMIRDCPEILASEEMKKTILPDVQVDDHKLSHPFLPFSKYTYILTVF